MRRSLSLVELLFSMVIIALAFTVLPKMVQLSSKIGVHSVQEEALYNAIAYMGLIKSTAWDEKNSRYNDILLADGSSEYDCPVVSFYRRGGFFGSRNCRNLESATASLGSDSDEPPYDDMDDFPNKSVQNRSGTRSFELSVNVFYIDDLTSSMDLFSSTPSAHTTTNTKYVEINVTSLARENAVGKQLGSIYYIGCNIGQVTINRYRWR